MAQWDNRYPVIYGTSGMYTKVYMWLLWGIMWCRVVGTMWLDNFGMGCLGDVSDISGYVFGYLGYSLCWSYLLGLFLCMM